jgi:hypothetical protein
MFTVAHARQIPDEFIMMMNSDNMQPKVTLANAFEVHLAYKADLIAAANECSIYDLEPFLKHDRCALGKWLYGVGMLNYGELPEFDGLVEAHQMFYCLMVVIAASTSFTETDSFHRALIESTHLQAASIEIGVAVDLLRLAVGP